MKSRGGVVTVRVFEKGVEPIRVLLPIFPAFYYLKVPIGTLLFLVFCRPPCSPLVFNSSHHTRLRTLSYPYPTHVSWVFGFGRGNGRGTGGLPIQFPCLGVIAPHSWGGRGPQVSLPRTGVPTRHQRNMNTRVCRTAPETCPFSFTVRV